VSMVEVNDGRQVLTLTERGFGKRTPFAEYRLTSRGGVGIINLNITDKNGKVVAVRDVADTDGVILISASGILIRTAVDQISSIGRNTQGVRVMRLEGDDKLVCAARVVDDD
jgi:DNA gyrase subunit A